MRRGLISPLVRSLSRKTGGHKVFITRSGFADVGTANLEEGHLPLVPVGGGEFYALRPSWTDEERYQMIGFSYVSGLVDWDGVDRAYRRGEIEEAIFRVYCGAS